jgi:hypothetical protein
MTLSCGYQALRCSGQYKTDVSFTLELAAVLTFNAHLASLDLSCRGRTRRRMGKTMQPLPQILAEALSSCRNMQQFEIECYDISDGQMLGDRDIHEGSRELHEICRHHHNGCLSISTARAL